MGWHHIGGIADEVYDARQLIFLGSSVLYKTAPYPENPSITGDVAFYVPNEGWRTIGGPGSMFAVNDVALWGLTPNKDAIFARFVSSDAFGPQGWERVSGPADTIIAGGGYIALYTHAENGDLYIYDSSVPVRRWLKIGGAGHMFAISNPETQGYYNLRPVYVYGVSSNQMNILRLRVDEKADQRRLEELVGHPWERLTRDNQLGSMTGAGLVLSRISSIIAGATDLYAEVELLHRGFPPPRNIYRYEGTASNWTQIGTRLGNLAIERTKADIGRVEMLYSLGPTDMKLRRYTGTGTNWQEIRPPFFQAIQRIFSGNQRILVTLLDGDLWQYSHY